MPPTSLNPNIAYIPVGENTYLVLLMREFLVGRVKIHADYVVFFGPSFDFSRNRGTYKFLAGLLVLERKLKVVIQKMILYRSRRKAIVNG